MALSTGNPESLSSSLTRASLLVDMVLDVYRDLVPAFQWFIS